ncbi:HET-domain-containing protein [Sordaria brevicollis]|uniref:HET-domain-containing protein n=1 Tax=Sordaria brevicollis TaxID=83679 RepID=A0AAE0PBT2_SORBR|nr:HET-domain-containing protein [Sordaria brevicollis]
MSPSSLVNNHEPRNPALFFCVEGLMMISKVGELCAYCAAIDFEPMRLPTFQSLQALINGKDLLEKPGFSYDRQRNVIQHSRPGLGRDQTLGRQSRVDSSAANCPLCRATSDLVRTSGLYTTHQEFFESDPECSLSIYCDPVDGPAIEIPLGLNFKLSSAATLLVFLGRISLTWNAPLTAVTKQPSLTLFDCFQTLDPVGDELLSDSESGERQRGLFSGRERPAIIDPYLPRRWLTTCLEDHKDTCPLHRSEDRRASTFRLIDTSTRAVVEFTNHRLGDVQYAALSYVWGNGHKTTLRRGTLTQLQLMNSLRVAGPQTVLDAIKFTSDMKVRYLWVDAFCIIQDDDDDKAAQLQLMAEIYQSALFTIVAAAGNDAQAGLPGVCISSEPLQQKVRVKKEENPDMGSLWLIQTLAPRDNMGDYAWSTRGWILQEKVLSRRVLTFTDKQLLWRCQQCKKWEEINTEADHSELPCSLRYRANGGHSPDIDPVTEPSLLHMGQGETTASPWQTLSSLISDFARRNLTVQGDAHDAFSAILKEYTNQTGVQFLWGLPADARFELALCWHYTTKPSELDPHAGKPLQRRQELTTLPSTSLQQRVPFPSWSWLGWRGPIDMPDLEYTQVLVSPRSEEIENPIVAYVLKNTPPRLVKTSTLTPDSSIQPTKKDSKESVVTLDMVMAEIPDLTFTRLSTIPDDQLLFFWTETARFFLSPPPNQFDRGRSVFNEKGEYCGDVGPLPGAEIATSENQHAEFIAVRRFTYICLVLQVERRDGIAYRVNMGQIDAQAWRRSRPRRELIALG